MEKMEYVKEVLKVSKPAWEAGGQMHTAFSSVLSLLLAGLAAFGITQGQIDLQFLGWILGIWCLVTFVFVAPYRLFDANRKTIRDLEEKIADKKNRTRIATLLATQMMKGRDFMAQCTNPEARGPVKDEHVNAWLEETSSVIRKELGSIYFALYETPDGTEPMKEFENKALNITWNGVRYRVLNLRKMIEEFNSP